MVTFRYGCHSKQNLAIYIYIFFSNIHKIFTYVYIYIYLFLCYVDTWRFLFEGSLCSFLGMGSSIPSEVGGISPQEEAANVIEMLTKKKERHKCC